MLIDNINYLRTRNRHLLQLLNKAEGEEKQAEVELTKSGQMTLKIHNEDSYKYVHSKYNPSREIDKLVDNFELPEDKSHILLFGFGMGIHYSLLKKKYPAATFSIYEPDLSVLNVILSHVSLADVLQKDQVPLIVEETVQNSVSSLLKQHQNKVEVFSLPFYQKTYQDKLDKLYQLLVNQLKDKRSDLGTNASFQKRWTINAMKNFPSVLQTPNILRDIDFAAFKDKSAIIVSAGPSLNEEFENLKYIKENGMAYIFSVGSAINALIENDILPDGICTYDPQAHNYKVIQKVKDKNISTIPLIFGSTAGYETLHDYQGPLVHMITNQDTVSSYLLNDEEKVDMVSDAPSIALITYQMLAKLGVKTIYLVGQNLSFKDRYRYATGVDYGKEQVKEDNLIPVQNVNGDTVWTNEGYNRMRKSLEVYIQQTPNIDVYNTTMEGAVIDGTTFLTLSEVIANHFTEHHIISEQWYAKESYYDVEKVFKRLDRLSHSQKQLERELIEVIQIVDKVYNSQSQYIDNSNKLEKLFIKFDKKFKKINSNRFNRIILSPMLRVQIEALTALLPKIKAETDVLNKADLFYKHLGTYIYQLNHLMKEIEVYFVELRENKVRVKEEVSK